MVNRVIKCTHRRYTLGEYGPANEAVFNIHYKQ